MKPHKAYLRSNYKGEILDIEYIRPSMVISKIKLSGEPIDFMAASIGLLLKCERLVKKGINPCKPYIKNTLK